MGINYILSIYTRCFDPGIASYNLSGDYVLYKIEGRLYEKKHLSNWYYIDFNLSLWL